MKKREEDYKRLIGELTIANCKMERLHMEIQCKICKFEKIMMKKSNLIDLFMRWYSYDRPHMSLDWEYQETPAQAFERKMLGEGQTVVDGQGITPCTILRMSLCSVAHVQEQIYCILTTYKHLIPFTDADRHNYNFIISGKPKGVTSWFETYAAMQAASGERFPTVAVVCLTDDTAKVKFVRKLLSESKKMMLKKSQ